MLEKYLVTRRPVREDTYDREHCPQSLKALCSLRPLGPYLPCACHSQLYLDSLWNRKLDSQCLEWQVENDTADVSL